MGDLLRDFVLAAGGALGGGLIVLLGQEFLSWLRRPVVRLSFDRNQHSAVVISVPTGFEGQPETVKLGTYFRLHVANDSRSSTAEGCEVVITRIERVRPTAYVYTNDPTRLGWSMIPVISMNLHPKTARFCDVLFLREDEFRIASQEVPNYLENELRSSFRGAEFSISLQVSGDNFTPERLNILCGWDAGAQNIVAREL